MTIPNQAQDLALSVLMSQQAKENRASETLAPVLRLVKTPRKEKAVLPSHNGKTLSSAPGLSFNNSKGDYTATQFMIAWRRAKDRNEMMSAINGYIGYDNGLAFSVNEYNAKTAAQKELRPVSHPVTDVTVQEKRGYVAGIPDNNMKKISDLLGREKLAAEALSNYELQISNLTEGTTEHLTAQGMAEIERERLVAIRADLSLLVK